MSTYDAISNITNQPIVKTPSLQYEYTQAIINEIESMQKLKSHRDLVNPRDLKSTQLQEISFKSDEVKISSKKVKRFRVDKQYYTSQKSKEGNQIINKKSCHPKNKIQQDISSQQYNEQFHAHQQNGKSLIDEEASTNYKQPSTLDTIKSDLESDNQIIQKRQKFQAKLVFAHDTKIVLKTFAVNKPHQYFDEEKTIRSDVLFKTIIRDMRKYFKTELYNLTNYKAFYKKISPICTLDPKLQEHLKNCFRSKCLQLYLNTMLSNGNQKEDSQQDGENIEAHKNKNNSSNSNLDSYMNSSRFMANLQNILDCFIFQKEVRTIKSQLNDNTQLVECLECKNF
eukprot:403371835